MTKPCTEISSIHISFLSVLINKCYGSLLVTVPCFSTSFSSHNNQMIATLWKAINSKHADLLVNGKNTYYIYFFPSAVKYSTPKVGL